MSIKQYKKCPSCGHEFIEVDYAVCHNCGYNFEQYSHNDASDGEFAKDGVCPHCEGDPAFLTCPLCKPEYRESDGEFEQEKCPACKGKGYGFIISKPCKKCNGTGKAPKNNNKTKGE